jgi:hypothetical protein
VAPGLLRPPDMPEPETDEHVSRRVVTETVHASSSRGTGITIAIVVVIAVALVIFVIVQMR